MTRIRFCLNTEHAVVVVCCGAYQRVFRKEEEPFECSEEEWEKFLKSTGMFVRLEQ